VLTRKTNYPVPAWAEIIDASDIGDDTDEEDDDS
jgi:hypothetical protein